MMGGLYLLLAIAAAGASPPTPQDLWAKVVQPGPFLVGVRTFAVPSPAPGEPDLLTEVWYPVDAADLDTPGAPPQLPPPAWRYPSGIRSQALPNAPIAPGRFPWLVFSHSFSAIRTQSTFLTEHLASHGFVVAAPDHRYSSAWDFQPLKFGKTIHTRPAEVSLVLDTLQQAAGTPNTFFSGRLDPERIGVMGHSLGGLTALLVAGAPVRGNGKEGPKSYADRRIQAVVALAPLVAPMLTPEALAEISRPTLLAVGTRDLVVPADKHARLAFDHLPGRRLFFEVPGGSHFAFSNREMLDGAPIVVRAFDNNASDRDVADSLIRGAVLSFLDYHLRRHDRYEQVLYNLPAGLPAEYRTPASACPANDEPPAE